ncbi:Uncharacterised protein [Vibrio cholerae]|nr:Uncharacterised protein [Vibrio cholerae]
MAAYYDREFLRALELHHASWRSALHRHGVNRALARLHGA